HVAGGFVMADEPDAALARIGGDRRGVEVRARFREAEFAALPQPVAAPAAVPTLDQHAAEAVDRGEVDVPLRVRGGRTVARTGTPGLGVEVQRPPDADVLEG